MQTTVGKPAFQSVAFAERMAVARALLRKSRRPSRTWPALTAAVMFAASSLAFVVVVVAAPAPFASSKVHTR